MELQDNFVNATWCVTNRVSCITINLFVDSTGNIVAYLGRGSASARMWQAAALDIQAPQLTNGTSTESWSAALSLTVASRRY